MEEEKIALTAEGESSRKEKEYGTSEATSKIKLLEINEIYEIIGFGRSQILYYILVTLVSLSDYVELTLLSVVLPTLRCQWGLTPTFEAAITLAAYGSYAVFAVLFGKVSDKFGRKGVIQWSTLALLLAAIGGAFSPNKWVFLATRLMTGACIGINISCIVCFGTEIAENKYRTLGPMMFVFPAFVGILLVNGVAFIALQAVGWRWLIILVSIPTLPALMLILFLPESPRYLCVSGQQERTMKALEFMAKLNGTELPPDVEVVHFEGEDLGSYSMIMDKTHRKSTIPLSVLYFSNIFLEFGLIVFLPLLYSSGTCGASQAATVDCKPLTQSDLLDLIYATSGSLVGTIVGLLSVQHIGRLIPIRISNLLMIMTLATLFFCVNHTFTLVTTTMVKIVEAFINVAIWVMMPESFPTNIRSTAMGFINGCGKVGGVLGTGSVYLLFYVSSASVVGVFVFCSVIGFLATMIYKRETKYEVLRET